jgi:ferredoxin
MTPAVALLTRDPTGALIAQAPNLCIGCEVWPACEAWACPRIDPADIEAAP